MFGYVKTDLPYMYVKDTVLYKAMYCGLCKAIGKTCGQKARLLLNYDLTFLSVFLHNVADKDVKINKEHCVIHHIIKRPVAERDELTERIARLNVILAHYKLNDDVMDVGKGRIKRAFFSKAYKKAAKAEPVLDKIVRERYAELIEYEKHGCDSIDMVSDPFGKMISETVSVLVPEASEPVKKLSYNLGKWIYLIDALDDFDKDKKDGTFNVFVNGYPDIESKAEFVEKKSSELSALFGGILVETGGLCDKAEFRFNHDLIDNILKRGLIAQTKMIMENKKCRNTSKF